MRNLWVIGSVLLIGMSVLMVNYGVQSRELKSYVPSVVAENNVSEKGYSDEFKEILLTCEAGDVKACTEATFSLYNFGDMENVIAISKRMCDQGHGGYCSELGTYYTDGIKGTEYDPKKGYEYYQLGCDLGDKYGCKGLKEFSIVEDHIVHHVAAKIAAKKASCQSGELDACVDLAEIYHHGNGVAVDSDLALSFYTKGCDTKELNTDRRCEGKLALLEEMGKL